MADQSSKLGAADRRLIALLRDDARAPVSALAKQLKLSRGTLRNRLALVRSFHRACPA